MLIVVFIVSPFFSPYNFQTLDNYVVSLFTGPVKYSELILGIHLVHTWTVDEFVFL